MYQLLILLLCFFLCCSCGRSINRWRNNSYIRDDGILPYQFCNAGRFSKSATQLVSVVIETFDVLFLASSVWGTSADSGEPITVKSVELMAYIKKSRSLFNACCGGHAFIHSNYAHTLMDRVTATCFISSSNGTMLVKESHGVWNYSKPTSKIPYKELKHPGVISLHCPLNLIAGTHSFDGFVRSDHLKLSVVFESKFATRPTSIDVDLCYEHIDKADELVVITEPIYGFKNQHVFAKQFWSGDPQYDRHNLLDAYIVYHTKVMGARVYINALHRDADEIMAKYENRVNVVYRPDWYKVHTNFSKKFRYPDDASSLILETLAYALGHWENRFRAKYFMILHSADNFAMCRIPNKTLSQCLSEVDYNRISAIHVPTCYGVTQNGTLVPSHNVLQRWSHCPGYFGDMRHTPIANPRHTDYVWVHWVSGRRPTFKYSANYSEALNVYHLQTKHIMQLGRSLSKGALASYAVRDEWQSQMGDMLQLELEPFLRKQP